MAVYACTDLHGRKDLLDKILEFLQPDDKVYFLGDAADRGKDGWEMIKIILNDNRFVYLKGNHEDMLVNAAKEYRKWTAKGDHFSHLCMNGGKQTFYDMVEDEGWWNVIQRLDQLPTFAYHGNDLGYNIFLSHAGFTPWRDEDDGSVYIPEDEDLIWNRDHYLEDHSDEELYPNAIAVHGHTPIPYIMDDLRLPDPGDLIDAGPLWYAHRHKVCLDCAAFATGAAFLLDLDTFDYHTFTVD